MSVNDCPHDAILVVSFGGPESREEVIPFLENVTRGRPIPRERLLEVAEHYYHFDGISPINQQVRDLISALRIELDAHQISLPIYWGNRNWHPYLPDTLAEMKQAGHRRVLAFITSGFSSYSGCRQYRENIIAAQEACGTDAPAIDKIRVFYNHPDFIAVNAENVQAALNQLDKSTSSLPQVIFTAHSIPSTMSVNCDYVQQLQEACRLVAQQLNLKQEQWELVYQSRSGRPTDPWLEPDILDALKSAKERGVRQVVVSPIGFLSDHMEVLYDLDDEANKLAGELGIGYVRAGTPGHHPRFVSMIRELIQERIGQAKERRAIGEFAANHDVCPETCCVYQPTRPTR